MRKICVISATRAEWYLLKNICKEIKADKDLTLQLIISGTHLSKEYGSTYKDVQKEFHIDKKVHILSKNNDSLGICKNISVAIAKFSQVLNELKPDIVVILGDRYEMLALATVCLILQIPIAHIYGGELSLGAIDDSIRHSITKMSSLHFVAANEYKKRVLQLGEEEKRVFFVGSLAGENIAKMKFLSKDELEKELGISFKRDIFLITYHPQTINSKDKEEFGIFLNELSKLRDSSLIFTKANADENGKFINESIEKFCKNNANAKLFDSLGALKYLSLMKISKAVLGNSSSGICESPFFKTPCINIGDRQRGRIRASNIIDCDIKNLNEALKRLDSSDFKENLKNFKNPFENKMASKMIKNVLKTVNLATILNKEFMDIKQ